MTEQHPSTSALGLELDEITTKIAHGEYREKDEASAFQQISGALREAGQRFTQSTSSHEDPVEEAMHLGR